MSSQIKKKSVSKLPEIARKCANLLALSAHSLQASMQSFNVTTEPELYFSAIRSENFHQTPPKMAAIHAVEARIRIVFRFGFIFQRREILPDPGAPSPVQNHHSF